MAFQNLRTGSTVYAFYKDNSPRLEIGQVIADPEFHAKYPQGQQLPGQNYNPVAFMNTQQEQVLKLSIKFGEKIQPFDGLKPTADIQDCGNGLFLSCNREAINAEVIAYKQLSDIALNPDVLATHKTISENCADIIAKINPEVAERQRIEAENKELKKELLEMKGMIGRLLEQLEGPSK